MGSSILREILRIREAFFTRVFLFTHFGDTSCAGVFASHPDRSPASPTLPPASSRCACLPLPASESGPSPAASRTPTIRCRPTPVLSDACACDSKTETGARSADLLSTDPAPVRTALRNPCACPPLPQRHRSSSPAPGPNTLALQGANQPLQIRLGETPRALDAPAIGQHQRE